MTSARATTEGVGLVGWVVAVALAAGCAPTPTSQEHSSRASSPVPTASASAPVVSPKVPAPEVTWLNPRDGANGTIVAVAAGDGVTYAFGEEGLVFRRRGDRWAQVDSELALTVHSATVLPNGHLVAIAGPDGGRVLARSVDDARTFEVLRKSSTRDPLAFVVHREPEILVSTENGRLLTSIDEGTTLFPYAELSTDVLAMRADPFGSVYVGGDHGRLFVSRARKAPWDKLDAGTTEPIRAIWSFAQEIVIGGGHYEGAGTSKGFVRTSRDGGKSFRAVPGVDAEVSVLLGVDKATFAVAAGNLLRRDTAAFAPAAPPDRRFWPVRQLVSEGSSFTAFGDDGARFVSLDAGRSFASRELGLRDDLAAVVALDARTLVVVGTATVSGKDRLPGSQEYAGVVARSEDAGRTWTRKTIEKTTALHELCGRKDLLFALGYMGAALKSVDGGKTFAPIASPGEYAACAVVGRNVVFAGKAGTIVRSIDAGATFETRTLPAKLDVRALEVVGDEILALGDEAVFASVDGGETWQADLTPSEEVGAVELANGLWIRVRDDALAWSTDRKTWTRKHVGARALVDLVRLDGGPDGVRALVVGGAGAIVDVRAPGDPGAAPP